MADRPDPIFADGFVPKRNDNAPDFVIINTAYKVDEAIAWLKKHEKNGWVNTSTKLSKAGKYFVELDQFTPKSQEGKKEEKVDDEPPF